MKNRWRNPIIYELFCYCYQRYVDKLLTSGKTSIAMKNAFKLIDFLINDSQALAAAMTHCDCDVKLADENDRLTNTLLKISAIAQAAEEHDIDTES